jgi:RNA polymerase sigma-70 factor (ECF subfamily)
VSGPQHGTERAFARLVQEERPALERHVRALGASPEDAEEVAASALLFAYRSRAVAASAGIAAVRRNLRAAAESLWRERQREAVRRRAGVGAGIDPVSGDASEQVEIAEDVRAALTGIARLPRMQRRVMELREIRGLSYSEIADELGMSVPAVESALHRARVSLARFTRRRGPQGLALAPLAILRRGADQVSEVLSHVSAAKVAVPVAVMAAGGASVGTMSRELPEPVSQRAHALMAPPRRTPVVRDVVAVDVRADVRSGLSGMPAAPVVVVHGTWAAVIRRRAAERRSDPPSG